MNVNVHCFGPLPPEGLPAGAALANRRLPEAFLQLDAVAGAGSDPLLRPDPLQQRLSVQEHVPVPLRPHARRRRGHTARRYGAIVLFGFLGVRGEAMECLGEQVSLESFAEAGEHR